MDSDILADHQQSDSECSILEFGQYSIHDNKY